MNNSRDQITFELINRYLKGDLSEAEVIEFKERMRLEASLHDEVERVRSETSLIEEYALRKHLTSIHMDVNTDRQKWISTRLRYISGIAASIILVITVSIILWNQNSSMDKLFDKYYEPYPVGVYRGGNNAKVSDFYKNYGAGEYQLAIATLGNKIEEYTEDDQMNLIIGNCYLSLHEASNAIEYLQRTKDSKSKMIAQGGEWFLALAYLKQGYEKRALVLLNNMAEKNHLFSKKAKSLLEDLK